jgi:hypothetical protein
MLPFLQELIKNLEAIEIDESEGPSLPVQADEHVVGILNDELKKLYVLIQHMDETINNITERARQIFISGEEDLTNLQKQFSLLASKGVTLHRIFWTEVRSDFPEVNDKPGIGLRAGWLVVWTYRREDALDDMPLDLLEWITDAQIIH